MKENPVSSQQLNGTNANIINNNNTAPKQTTKEDSKSNFLLRRSGRIDCHHSVDRKNISNVTTPTSTSSTITRTRMYLDRSALKGKGSAISSSNDLPSVQNHNKITENLDRQICPDDNDDGDYIWEKSIASDADGCDDSVTLDLDLSSNKSRIERSNSVKRGKRSLSCTRVAKTNEKNMKRKTASESPQQLTSKVDDVAKKEIKPSTANDGGKSDRYMSLRLRKR